MESCILRCGLHSFLLYYWVGGVGAGGVGVGVVGVGGVGAGGVATNDLNTAVSSTVYIHSQL